jgi:hypothetical protein
LSGRQESPATGLRIRVSPASLAALKRNQAGVTRFLDREQAVVVQDKWKGIAGLPVGRVIGGE